MSVSRHECVADAHPALESLWEKNYELRKEMWKTKALANTAAAPPLVSSSQHDFSPGIRDGSAFRSVITTPVNATLRQADQLLEREESSSVPDVNAERTVQSLISGHQLNAEQARAFSIVAEHSQSKESKQLRMYLGGPGGTGKSRVINALQDYFEGRGEERRFRLASFTGVAARNISGMTLHAALMMGSQYGGARSAKGKQNLMAMWEGVDYLLVDEISMVGCALLNDISHALSIAKGNDLAFGGVNVVFAGDFAQLPPVGQKRLYQHLDNKDISKAATARGQKTVFGKLLWLSVDTVVMLTQNMRQTGPENEPFVALLGRLREGRCTTADYELLNTRLAENLDIDWEDSPWNRAPVIVTENAMKDALNVKMAHDFAIRTGRPLHWYYASDAHAKNGPITDDAVRDKLMQMDSGKTNSRLGRVPLVIGMPVIISQNFDVPGGVVNGCLGTLISVRYSIGADGKRHALSCIVEAPDTTPGIFEELPDHHVVSLRDTTEIVFKHPHCSKKMAIRRTQLPILPAFSITAHKAQGKTLDACVVNFTGCRGTESPYVMVSRATSLEALVILTPFSKDKICCRQSEETRVEFKHLRYLELQTVISYGGPEESAQARKELQDKFGSVNIDIGEAGEHPAVRSETGDDMAARLRLLQRRHEEIGYRADKPRLQRVAVDAPVGSAGSASRPSRSGLLKAPRKRRNLDDTTETYSASPRPKKRAKR